EEMLDARAARREVAFLVPVEAPTEDLIFHQRARQRAGRGQVLSPDAGAAPGRELRRRHVTVEIWVLPRVFSFRRRRRGRGDAPILRGLGRSGGAEQGEEKGQGLEPRHVLGSIN